MLASTGMGLVCSASAKFVQIFSYPDETMLSDTTRSDLFALSVVWKLSKRQPFAFLDFKRPSSCSQGPLSSFTICRGCFRCVDRSMGKAASADNLRLGRGLIQRRKPSLPSRTSLRSLECMAMKEQGILLMMWPVKDDEYPMLYAVRYSINRNGFSRMRQTMRDSQLHLYHSVVKNRDCVPR